VHAPRVGVWCTSHGPIFLDIINAECCCDSILYPLICHLSEDQVDSANFQQECALAHTEAAPWHLWRQGDFSIFWPRYSPHLTLTDFPWGTLNRHCNLSPFKSLTKPTPTSSLSLMQLDSCLCKFGLFLKRVFLHKVISLLCYRLDDQGSVFSMGRERNFCLCHSVQTGSGAHPASYPMGSRDFPRIKVASALS
jgi:hypothetical protein